jgi:hypothetical protein
MVKSIGKSLKVFLIFVSLIMVSCLWHDPWGSWGPPTQYAEKNAYPDFAYDGQNLFVVWGGDDIYGRIISPEGNYVTPIFEIANSENIEAEPEIAFLDPSFMVVWEEHLGEGEVRICCKRYNRKYSPTREHPIEILRGEGLSSPRIEKHSDGFVVLWYEWDMLGYDCYLSLFNLDGRELQREFLYDYTQPYASLQPLVRADNEDRYFLRGKSSARILGQDLEPIYELDFPDGAETYCCYGYDKWLSFEECREDTFPYIGHLTIKKIGFDGSVIPPEGIVVESEMDYFRNLTVCSGDNIFLCVWQQYDNEGSTVNYIRLDSDGNLIDEESFVLFKNVYYEWARLEYAENKFYWLWRSWKYDESEDAEFDEKINLCMFSQAGGSLSARFVQVAK